MRLLASPPSLRRAAVVAAAAKATTVEGWETSSRVVVVHALGFRGGGRGGKRALSTMQNRPPIDRRAPTSALFAAASSLVAGAGVVAAVASGFADDDGVPIRATTTVHLEGSVDDVEEEGVEDEDETTTILNWSGTHSATLPNSLYREPETVEELERIVRDCHERGIPMRPIGAALSPNGMAFREGGMVSLANLNDVLEVDERRRTVTVQAGARVSQVVDALRERNLTLPNLASIAEQQIGGFVQIGAHGTGATIPPVDDFVVSLKLVTPAFGTVKLDQSNPLFPLVKVGLGCFGIVSEVTLKCVPAHDLVERTFVLTRDEAIRRKEDLLRTHRHVRYMWIPYEDAVVVVTNDPVQKTTIEENAPPKRNADDEETAVATVADRSRKERFRPLVDLLLELRHAERNEGKTVPNDDDIEGMGFGDLRDALLAYDPLNVEHVKRCNAAEAEFWKRNEGTRVEPSDKLLQFDCGGQQWVFEQCFPTGTLDFNNGNDMYLVTTLLSEIERRGIPAPAPIEQRWTSSSTSIFSPANGLPDDLFSWVGIIMYLPEDDGEDDGDRRKRKEDIADVFKDRYCHLYRATGDAVNAVPHWGKLELPNNDDERRKLRARIRRRYPVEEFLRSRRFFDPKGLLSNDVIDAAFGSTKEEEERASVFSLLGIEEGEEKKEE